MSETYEMSLWLHSLASWALAGLLAIHLFFVFWGAPKSNLKADGLVYIRRLYLFLPAYYAFLAVLFFTGILNLAIIKFELSWRDWVMIALFVPLVALGVSGFLRLKKLNSNGDYMSFQKFMSSKIAAELVIIVFASYLGTGF